MCHNLLSRPVLRLLRNLIVGLPKTPSTCWMSRRNCRLGWVVASFVGRAGRSASSTVVELLVVLRNGGQLC